MAKAEDSASSSRLAARSGNENAVAQSLWSKLPDRRGHGPGEPWEID